VCTDIDLESTAISPSPVGHQLHETSETEIETMIHPNTNTSSPHQIATRIGSGHLISPAILHRRDKIQCRNNPPGEGEQCETRVNTKLKSRASTAPNAMHATYKFPAPWLSGI